MAKSFLEKLEKLELKRKQRDKIAGWYLDDITNLRWALRVSLDRYRMEDLDKAEAILTEYDNL